MPPVFSTDAERAQTHLVDINAAEPKHLARQLRSLLLQGARNARPQAVRVVVAIKRQRVGLTRGGGGKRTPLLLARASGPCAHLPGKPFPSGSRAQRPRQRSRPACAARIRQRRGSQPQKESRCVSARPTPRSKACLFRRALDDVHCRHAPAGNPRVPICLLRYCCARARTRDGPRIMCCAV